MLSAIHNFLMAGYKEQCIHIKFYFNLGKTLTKKAGNENWVYW